MNIEDDNYLVEFANVTQNLMSVIHSLILNPGHFTLIVPPLINNLRPYLGIPSQFQEIIKIIIQQVYCFFVLFLVLFPLIEKKVVLMHEIISSL